MIPIFQWIVARTAARTRLRHCLKCGHTQLVRGTAAVACKRCGRPLPPPSVKPPTARQAGRE
jgi:uncharacterized paraquat-inducible protein A